MARGSEAKLHVEEPPPKVRIKKAKGGGHHGGAWKVAYADFITALMALFLLLWLVGSASDEQKRAIAGYFRDDPMAIPGQPSPGLGILDGQASVDLARLDSLALEDARVTLEKVFSSGGRFAAVTDQILIQETAEGLNVDLIDKESHVFFEVGSTEVKPQMASVLREITRAFGKLDNRIIIAGHTDRRPYSTGAVYSNWELSTGRASAARRVMTEAGLPDSVLAQVTGYADTRLLIPSDPEAAANRRIGITVLRKYRR
jgi:chemotaxis protein MotB